MCLPEQETFLSFPLYDTTLLADLLNPPAVELAFPVLTATHSPAGRSGAQAVLGTTPEHKGGQAATSSVLRKAAGRAFRRRLQANRPAWREQPGTVMCTTESFTAEVQNCIFSCTMDFFSFFHV